MHEVILGVSTSVRRLLNYEYILINLAQNLLPFPFQVIIVGQYENSHLPSLVLSRSYGKELLDTKEGEMVFMKAGLVWLGLISQVSVDRLHRCSSGHPATKFVNVSVLESRYTVASHTRVGYSI